MNFDVPLQINYDPVISLACTSDPTYSTPSITYSYLPSSNSLPTTLTIPSPAQITSGANPTPILRVSPTYSHTGTYTLLITR